MTTSSYKARLIFAARAPGLLNWDTPRHSWTLPTGHRAELRSRPDGSLAEATEFHIDVVGFATVEEARTTGEQLRGALRLANAVLGIGLNVPAAAQEIPRARIATDMKEEIARSCGTAVAECVFGLNVLKQDEEVEYVVKGRLSTSPRDSTFMLDAIDSLWGLEDRLDTPSRTACELLNTAARDPSPRSGFLVSFLALDVLLERRKRPEEAQEVLKTLRRAIDGSSLPQAEQERLHSFIGQWKHTSLGAEIERFVEAGANAEIVVQGERLGPFLDACMKLRHCLAHPTSSDDGSSTASERELNKRRLGLREVVRGLVWARNSLPDLKIDYPGDAVRLISLKVALI